MVLRRALLLVAVRRIACEDNYNLDMTNQDDRALDTNDDWRDAHPDWLHETEYSQQCQAKLQKDREQRWICDTSWCDSDGRDCYDGPPPAHLKYGSSSVGSEVKQCIFSYVECRSQYNYACCKHKPSGQVVFGIVFPIIMALMLLTAVWPQELELMGYEVGMGTPRGFK